MILSEVKIIEIIFALLKVIFLLLFVVFSGALLSVIERRLLALFQNRYGPNRVGWMGSLQLLADMIKILFKEDWIPSFSRKFIFVLSPIIAFISLLCVIPIIPFTSHFVIIDLNIGILFF